MCVFVSVGKHVDECEPGRDKVIKILLTVQGVSNYKQAYFSFNFYSTQTDRLTRTIVFPSLWRHYTLIKRVLFLRESRTESVIIPFLNSARSDRTSTGGFMRRRELVLSLYLFIRHFHTLQQGGEPDVPYLVKHGGNGQCSYRLVMIYSNRQGDS